VKGERKGTRVVVTVRWGMQVVVTVSGVVQVVRVGIGAKKASIVTEQERKEKKKQNWRLGEVEMGGVGSKVVTGRSGSLGMEMVGV